MTTKDFFVILKRTRVFDCTTEVLVHISATKVQVYMHVYNMFHFHLHTGILAGMWPCGVITLIGELYVAEAKTQVYGFLHSIVHHNAQHLSSLGEFS